MQCDKVYFGEHKFSLENEVEVREKGCGLFKVQHVIEAKHEVNLKQAQCLQNEKK